MGPGTGTGNSWAVSIAALPLLAEASGHRQGQQPAADVGQEIGHVALKLSSEVSDAGSGMEEAVIFSFFGQLVLVLAAWTYRIQVHSHV